METDLVKMSPKGQLVVPQDIREKEGFNPGDRFVPFHIADGILFKKVKIPDVKSEFEKLSKQIELKLKKQNVTSADVDEAVRLARKK
ncbi:MAG: AbrB/MazE/SpoVT family DNA-binding domain-containing protein [Nanoarchaeota archaeon]